jgi:hypothetical protein
MYDQAENIMAESHGKLNYSIYGSLEEKGEREKKRERERERCEYDTPFKSMHPSDLLPLVKPYLRVSTTFH